MFTYWIEVCALIAATVFAAAVPILLIGLALKALRSSFSKLRPARPVFAAERAFARSS
jgi:hypothetical protein